MTVKNKLVRDNIPEIIKLQNYNVSFRILNDTEYKRELYKKLLEESDELISDENLEECADVYEVLKTISENLGFSMEDVIKKAEEKRNKKGSFKDKIFLESYEKK